jgi:histidinol-phosphate aminotransferase
MQGPSPEVIKAIQNFDPYKATYYAEGYYDSALANALSKRLGIIKDRIIVCYGAEDFLRAAFDSLDVKTDSVLTHEYYYGYYKTYLEGKGLILNTFKVKEGDNSFSFDIKDCIEQYKLHQPKILIIASPNNPTGNSISLPELKNILNTVDSKTLVILDEAYWGFDPGYEEQSFLVLLERHPNLAILRSFSKYYALAGLRIGFVLCGAEVKKILRYENLYLGMSRLLEDVAIAALNSETYYKRDRRRTHTSSNRDKQAGSF